MSSEFPDGTFTYQRERAQRERKPRPKAPKEHKISRRSSIGVPSGSRIYVNVTLYHELKRRVEMWIERKQAVVGGQLSMTEALRLLVIAGLNATEPRALPTDDDTTRTALRERKGRDGR